MKKQFIQQFPYSAEYLKNQLIKLTKNATARSDRACIQDRFQKTMSEMNAGAQRAVKAMYRVTMQTWQKDHPDYDKQDGEIVKQALTAPALGDLSSHTNLWSLLPVLGKQYTPGETLTIGDVYAKSPGLTQIIVSDLAHTATANVKETSPCVFAWTGSHQYASKNIEFRIDNETVLRYDECGKLRESVQAFECPYLAAELDYDFGCDKLYAVTGVFTGGADGGSFCPTDSQLDFSHVMLIAKWGGAASKKRGRKDGEGLPMIYFEKVSSKGGGEGCDHYVLEAKQGDVDFCRLLLDEICDKVERQALREAEFAQKVALLPDILESLRGTHDLVTEMNRVLCNMNQSAIKAPAAAHSFVKPPQFAPIDYTVCMPSEHELLQYPLTALMRMGDDMEAYASISNYVLTAKVRLKAWETFAPRYAELYPLVADTLHGWLEVEPDKAVVYLSKQDDSDDDNNLVIRLEYAFSEKQLSNCIEFLKQYAKTEAEMAEKNREFLSELAKTNASAEEK